jgi:hypothetical protein
MIGLFWSASLLAGCSRSEPTPPDAVRAPELASKSDARGADRPAPSAEPAPPASLPSPGAAAPPRGCRLEQEFSLREDAARAWAVGVAGQPHFLVLRAARRRLEWWSGTAPALVPRGAHDFAVPVARLAVLRGPAGAGADVHSLALVDDKGELWCQRHAGDRFDAPRSLAQGADRRFDPALAFAGEQLLTAFTRTVDLAMHTFVVRCSGQAAPAIDVTPPGHGAAAASFVLGASFPSLVMLDARGGVSPLLELPFDERGQPGAVLVRTPISQPYAPPALSAVALPGGEVEVAFTAIGKLAATAIGRVPLRRAAAPSALHASRGYGQLSFGVALGARAAVYALEVPRDEGKDAPHLIEIKWVDAQGDGETLALPASSDSARLPSIAALTRGRFLLAYVSGASARAGLLHCAD